MTDEHIIIDGYNAIFRSPELRELARENLEQARNELVRRLAEAFRGRRERVTVVYDGNRATISGGRTRYGSVRVTFSIPPQTADDKIQRLVEEARRVVQGRRRLDFRIVSSDREVAGRAKLWGARSVGVQDFLAEVEKRWALAAEARLAGEQADFRRKSGPQLGTRAKVTGAPGPPASRSGAASGGRPAAGGGARGGDGTGRADRTPSDASRGGPGRGGGRRVGADERDRKPRAPGASEVDEWERLFRERRQGEDDEEGEE